MNCPNCGAVVPEGAKFCEACGTRLDSINSAKTDDGWDDIQDNSSYDDGYSTGQGGYNEEPGYGGGQGGYSAGGMGGAPVQPRSIGLAIVLSIITCGIYSIYWIYMLNEEVSQVAGEDTQPSGGILILLGLVTCGIYWWYWFFKKGEQVERIKINNGGTGGSESVLYLVLAIFGLSIVNLALMQDTVNKYGA